MLCQPAWCGLVLLPNCFCVRCVKCSVLICATCALAEDHVLQTQPFLLEAADLSSQPATGSQWLLQAHLLAHKYQPTTTEL